MWTNPFKSPRGELIRETQEVKAQQWGNVKFSPNFTRKGIKSKSEHKEKLFDKSKAKSTAKFNVIAKNARPENATPWRIFKNEIALKDAQRIGPINVESKEAERILKQRDLNYKKLVMLEKMKEPTIWEDFQDDKNENPGKSTKSSKAVTKNVKLKKKKDIVSPEVLQNFNSRKLTAEQNNKLRRLITKGTTNLKGTTLSQIVNNLKYCKKKSEK